MNAVNTNTAAARVSALVAEGKDKRIIEAMLTIEGFTPKDIKEATKSLAQKKTNFAAEYYNWLASGKRDMKDVEAYIMGKGEFGKTSSNVQNHLSHYKNIAELANTIWSAKPKPESEATAEPEVKAEPKADKKKAK